VSVTTQVIHPDGSPCLNAAHEAAMSAGLTTAATARTAAGPSNAVECVFIGGP
jgi:hypothetical protein